MTKEELEVKAKEYSVKKFDTVWNIAVKVYKAGYRACTKEVKQLGERCNQLCKAKEIIKKFVHHYKDKTIYIENMQDLLEQAEQFVREVEK